VKKIVNQYNHWYNFLYEFGDLNFILQNHEKCKTSSSRHAIKKLMSNMIVFELSIIKKLQSLLFNFLLWCFQNILSTYIFVETVSSILDFQVRLFIQMLSLESQLSIRIVSWLVFFLFCLDSFFYLWRIDFCTLCFDSFVGTISIGSSNLLNPSVTVKVKNQKIFEKKKLLIFFFCWQSSTYILTLKPLLFLW
jgi:hypothetical protein